MAEKFEEGDRVKKAGGQSPVGTIQNIRTETVKDSIKEAAKDDEAPSVTVTVLWDNGTLSHFVPDGLERA